MTRQKQILLMDDDPHVCAYLEDLLRYYGYGVDCAQSCKAARKRVETRAYDGYLMDLWMADGRGDQMLDWLREQGHAEPVVMMSGLADYDLWIDLVNKGAADLIPKPIQPAQLKRVLELAFAESHAGKSPANEHGQNEDHSQTA